MTTDTAKPAPSELAYVPFVSVENMMRLVHHVGIETFLTELADHIEADFKRWPVRVFLGWPLTYLKP